MARAEIWSRLTGGGPVRIGITAPRTGSDLALGVAMVTAIAFNALLTARTDRYWPFGVGIGVVICGSALLRGGERVWAVATGLSLFALTGLAVVLGAIPPEPLYGGGLAGLLVLGAAAVRRVPPRTAAVIGVAGTLVIGAGETVGPVGLYNHRLVWVLVGATAWSVALAIGLYLRYLDFLHAQALENARREERLDLARELHDVVAHHVTGMVVLAQAARFAGQDRVETLLLALDSIEDAGTGTLSAVRQLVGLLRDPVDAADQLDEPISALVQRFSEHGPPVDLRLSGAAASSGWPPHLSGTVYRIVQEALTNIVRHAPGARAVTVSVSQDAEQVTVEVADDAPAQRHHRSENGYGLVGMRERVEALGGELRAGPLPGAGWTVRASLPVVAGGRL